MAHPEIPTVEWFFGAGGNHRGLKYVLPRLRLIAACEIEGYPLANLVAKMEEGALDSAPVWTDVRTFPSHQLRDRVALFVASYPCQPFSCAGQRAGVDDPRHLWPYVLRGVRAMRPARCFFENVEGHLSLGLSTVISDLEDAGYIVKEGLFSAAEVGASHRRKRVFIMADRADGGWQRLWLPARSRNQRPRTSHPQRHGPQLAHAEHGPGCPQRRPESGRGDVPFPPCHSELGIAGHSMADTQRLDGSGHDEALHRTGLPHGPRSEDGDATMDYSSGSRHQGAAREWPAALPESGECLPCPRCGHLANPTCLPAFPPGPGLGGHGVLADIGKLLASDPERAWQRYRAELANTIEWQSILAIAPHLEPALCRVAHGLAHRVDRLRLCGNGVVPDTAALAWVTLSAQLDADLSTLNPQLSTP